MKWPEYIMLVRHDVSAYNALKKLKDEDPLYQQFKKEYENDYRSEKTQKLAEEVHQKYDLGSGDHDTPLLPESSRARSLGRRMRADNFPIPDVIFVSPYARTLNTLD